MKTDFLLWLKEGVFYLQTSPVSVISDWLDVNQSEILQTREFRGDLIQSVLPPRLVFEEFVVVSETNESNSREVKDCLRKIALVPELHGWVNSQLAEQLFSTMRKNKYFLNMTSLGAIFFSCALSFIITTPC